MLLQNPFAALSPTGLDSQILTVLARSEQYLTVQQIHRLLPEEGSLQGVRLAVARLVVQGTVLERVTGRSSAFALNQNHLLTAPILQIANAKQELVDRVAQRISEWTVQPLTVKLFGSAARNDMDIDSDIDLFFVMPDEADADETEALVDQLAEHVNHWTGNDVRPLIYSASEIRTASIFDSIIKDGIDISGDPSWLRKQLRHNV